MTLCLLFRLLTDIWYFMPDSLLLIFFAGCCYFIFFRLLIFSLSLITLIIAIFFRCHFLSRFSLPLHIDDFFSSICFSPFFSPDLRFSLSLMFLLRFSRFSPVFRQLFAFFLSPLFSPALLLILMPHTPFRLLPRISLIFIDYMIFCFHAFAAMVVDDIFAIAGFSFFLLSIIFAADSCRIFTPLLSLSLALLDAYTLYYISFYFYWLDAAFVAAIIFYLFLIIYLLMIIFFSFSLSSLSHFLSRLLRQRCHHYFRDCW